MKDKDIKDAEDTWASFHTYASLQSIMSKEQVNYMLRKHGDFLFCHGHGRKVVADPLTSDTYKVYTKPI